ncbi:MAG: L-ascorbate metabolism protein UlaG (beta-lactamase superfamily) [Cognaticolwellia sp.]|jgi:L-ascorbate metabolism protein UlaG (beta-lactamase superfamily)
MKRLLKPLLSLSGFGVLAAGGVLVDAWEPMGTAPEGARLERMLASPQHDGEIFVNPQAMFNDYTGMFTTFAESQPSTPEVDLPILRSKGELFDTPPESGLRVTWLGHSTQIFEIDGVRLITDPIFGGRAGPVDWAGPQVWYAPPIALDDLPEFDAVLISHDHYDHLQQPTIERMAAWETQFIVPLGVGAHLEYWGVDPTRITELDWWESTTVGPVEVNLVPSRHASGRHLLDQMRTLWGGYAIVGPENRIYFSGDTGLFPAMEEIGERYGPFDVALIEVGAYDQAWPDWHMGPENALRGADMVNAKSFLPIHWGLWNLANHGWTEPVERAIVAAEKRGMPMYVPKPGESLEPSALPALERWWPELPWRTVEEYAINTTKVPAE